MGYNVPDHSAAAVGSDVAIEPNGCGCVIRREDGKGRERRRTARVVDYFDAEGARALTSRVESTLGAGIIKGRLGDLGE